MNVKRVFLLMTTLLVFILSGCAENSAEKSESTKDSESSSESAFPEKEIELIIPYSPGGNTDILARVMAEAASKHLPNNQRMTVVNKPGGGATIGMLDLKNSASDGHTISIIPLSSVFISPYFTGVDYSHEDFDPIVNLANVTQSGKVNISSKYKTADEFLKYAENNRVTIGHQGGMSELISSLLKARTGFELELIPYAGNADVDLALLSNEVDIGVGGLPSVMNNEDIIPIFSAGSERSEFASDVETLSENDVDMELDLLYSVIAPKGLPDHVKKTIEDAFLKALEDEEVKQKLEELAYEILPQNSEEFTEVFEEMGIFYKETFETLESLKE